MRTLISRHSVPPALSLSIGYAPRSKPRELQRLLAGQEPRVVQIDYSYNEAVLDVEVLRLTDGETLNAYSQINLMAEKYRSLLQHPSRRRNRRQDVVELKMEAQFNCAYAFTPSCSREIISHG